jgi:hypothetical protein
MERIENIFVLIIFSSLSNIYSNTLLHRKGEAGSKYKKKRKVAG